MNRVPRCRLLASILPLLATAGAAYAANTISVPNGGSGACGAGNPNAARFSGNCGAEVAFDGASSGPAYVQDNSPANEVEYRARLYVNLRKTVLGGDGHDLFAAYSGSEVAPPGDPAASATRFRLYVEPAANGEELLFVATRLGGGSEVVSNPGILLTHGWHSVEIRWTLGTSFDGLVELWVNGSKRTAEMAGMINVSTAASALEGIEFVRWGAVAGVEASSGSEQLDDFVSRRQDYIGPVQALSDVPLNHMFFKEIQGFYAGGVTAGCASNPPSYCPTNQVNRGAMAVFIMRAKKFYLEKAADFTPPTAQNLFADPEFDANLCAGTPSGCALLFMEPWAEAMYQAGITAGCSTNPLKFCPGNPTNRGAMAVFILRALNSPGYAPPAARNLFSDPEFDPTLCAGTASGCSLLFMEPWAEAMYDAGITTGCATNPLKYCPANPTLRQAMAAFLTRSFSIPYHYAAP